MQADDGQMQPVQTANELDESWLCGDCEECDLKVGKLGWRCGASSKQQVCVGKQQALT